MTTSVPVAISILGAVPVQAQNHEFSFSLGGGITTPLNPTGAYAGVSGNFVGGAGCKINNKNAIIAEFLWSGLPSNLFVVSPISDSNVVFYTFYTEARYHPLSVGGFVPPCFPFTFGIRYN